MESEIESLKQKLKECPDGKLIIIHNGKYVKYYSSDGHKSTLIPKKDWSYAGKLAYKKYIMLRLELVQSQYGLLKSKENQYKNAEKRYMEFMLDAEIRKLLSGYDIVSMIDAEWQNAEFEKNTRFPEKLIHETVNGLKVRSKSESIIALALAQHKIPFKYECKLCLNGVELYPDFTLKHPISGKLIYFEHFGMMDDSSYANDAYRKIRTYVQNGILPNRDLLMTFEDSAHPLGYDTINKVLDAFF